MAEARANDPISDVVRTRRFELLDDRDRLRAVIETGDGDEGSIETGLRILDARGSERLLVAHMAWGAVISLAHEGDTVLEIECMDDLASNAYPGSKILLCDGGSTPVMRWFVGLDGQVIEERPVDGESDDQARTVPHPDEAYADVLALIKETVRSAIAET